VCIYFIDFNQKYELPIVHCFTIHRKRSDSFTFINQ